MCGRYFVEIDENELKEIVEEAERYSRNEPAQISFTGGEIFPSNVVPVVSSAGARFMKWGFPSLVKNRPPIINARSETAITTRTFSDAMQHRRCLIPATAYFEWQTIDKKQKLKYEFSLSEHGVFFMAAIFTPNKEFAILTREAIPEFIPIHDRMPVVIPRTLKDQWLHETPSVIERAFTDLQSRKADTDGPEQTSFLV